MHRSARGDFFFGGATAEKIARDRGAVSRRAATGAGGEKPRPAACMRGSRSAGSPRPVRGASLASLSALDNLGDLGERQPVAHAFLPEVRVAGDDARVVGVDRLLASSSSAGRPRPR